MMVLDVLKEEKNQKVINPLFPIVNGKVNIMNTRRVFSTLVIIIFLTALFAGLANVPVSAQTAKKYVVFRDDDIGFGTMGSLQAVNQVHIDENVPVTLAIIPHPATSRSGNEMLEDPLHSYLQSIVTNPIFEFAQHGYNHYNYAQNGAPSSASTVGGVPQVVGAAAPYYGVGENTGPGQLVCATSGVYSEFWGRTFTDQYNAIKQGRDDITQAFGVTPRTFVPPWNKGDDNTLKAVSALGFTLYSTADTDFNVHEATLNGVVVQGEGTGVGWDTYDNWVTGIQQVTQATDNWLNTAAAGDRYVVGYHAWSFENSDGSLDSARIALFKQYIEHLKNRGDVLFTTLGGQQLLNPSSDVAVCSQDGNSLDVFAQGAYRVLWHKHWDSATGWSAWESLGGVITSAPAVTSPYNGAINLYVRGSDGALWSKQLSGGVWGDWSKIGGQLLAGTGPAAYSVGSDRIGWFVTGTDHALYHMWLDAAGNVHGWEKLGGYLTSSPGATSRPSGAIDVFVRGGDNALWWRSYESSSDAWGAWSSVGGLIASGTGPAACAKDANSLDVFVQGSNNALWHRSLQGSSWSAWESLGGVLTSSPASTSPSSGLIDVFARGSDNTLWERSYSTGWNIWMSSGSAWP
jgi:Uncharacterized protein conserved in bacteria (DUF2334)